MNIGRDSGSPKQVVPLFRLLASLEGASDPRAPTSRSGHMFTPAAARPPAL